MNFLSLFALIALVTVIEPSKIQHDILKKQDYETTVLLANYFQDVTVTVNRRREFVIHFDDSTSRFPYRVFAWSNHSEADFPIFIMTRQQREPTSWEIPLLVESKEGLLAFRRTSRTLCHNSMDIISDLTWKTLYNDDQHGIGSYYSFYKQLSVSVSTLSFVSTNVTIRVEEAVDFFIEENQNYTMTISPSEPRFYYYKYPEKNNSSHANTIIMEVQSQDETCLILSIQNATCPIFDLNEDISYKGYYETIDTKGGIIIKKSEFPMGFFVVFVAKADNYDCNLKTSSVLQPKTPKIKPSNHSSIVWFRIVPDIAKTEYLKYTLDTLAVLLIFSLIFGSVSFIFLYFELKKRQTQQEPERISQERPLLPKNKQNATTSIELYDSINTIPDSSTEQQRQSDEVHSMSTEDQGSSSQEINIKKPESLQFYLSDFSIEDPKHAREKALNYSLLTLIVAIVYGIPAVQVVAIHLRLIDVTGNLDTCYYNFLCAHPLGILKDYNHVLSNAGYICFGVLFLGIVIYRDRKIPNDNGCGIPKQRGLFFAMGIALSMEGGLSACYHICPNRLNFQFDTSFMYIMAVLSLMKLYEKRHPNIDATAYFTFLFLAITILIATVGILNDHYGVWIASIVLYIIICGLIAFKMCFVEYATLGFKRFWNVTPNNGFQETLVTIRKAWPIYVGIGIALNVIMACMGSLFYSYKMGFGTFLLFLLLGNAFIYIAFYIIMKMVVAFYQAKNHKTPTEMPSLQSLLYLILCLITWGFALNFFLDTSSEWTVTPAISKHRNSYCKMLFYDSHDIWHFLSAAALFFSFMLLLTVDDNLMNTPRNEILIF